MPGGWRILGKGELLTNRDLNKFVRNKLSVYMEHFWDLLFQLIKQHGTNTIYVAFIYALSIFHSTHTLPF